MSNYYILIFVFTTHLHIILVLILKIMAEIVLFRNFKNILNPAFRDKNILRDYLRSKVKLN